MALIPIRFDSIFGGHTQYQYGARPGQYLKGVGIDPDLPISDAVGDRLTSGAIRPSAYAKFSGANIDSNVIAIITTPKTSLIYAVTAGGKIISYTSAFGSETLVGTVTGSNAEGAFYYNNYIYITGTGASKNDISRYGPLDNSPAITNAWWSGLSLTALTNNTYPSLRGGGTIPQHWGHVHTDNFAYFCDFKNGQGFISAIKTSKTTDEGDTNNGSAYNVLDLPFGYYPVDIESYGTDLAIAAFQTTNGTITQGKAAIFLWDTVSGSFYEQVPLLDPLVTALLNNNGRLTVFSGSISTGTDVSNGYRISVVTGPQSVQETFYSNEGHTPIQGAVASIGNKLMWGTFQQVNTTTPASPTYYASVMALGSKDASIPSGLHGIVKTTATATAADGLVTAIANVQNSSFSYPKLAVGWRDSTSFGIDSQSTTYGTSLLQFPKVVVGRPFVVKQVRMNLGTAVAANMTITPTVFLDDFSSSSTTGLTVINSTNYASSQRHILMYPDINGDHDFTLQLVSSGTALLPILLPVEVLIETKED
jgi:hypothetical protein